MQDEFTSPETVNGQVAQIKAIFDGLVEVKDGKESFKPGVTREQVLFAMEECKKIKASYDKISAERQDYFNDVALLNKKVLKVRSQAMYLEERWGSGFFPAWYKKFLGMK